MPALRSVMFVRCYCYPCSSLMLLKVDDISTIFDVTERTFASGSVSWADTGGSYYVHRVDRAGYSEIRKRFESSRGIRSTRRGI